MVTVNLSMDQLEKVIYNLDEEEKDRIRQLLNDDEYILSPEQENILMERHKAYEMEK